MGWSDWIQAGIGAYSGYQNAQAANRPQNTQTNQTTTNTPFGLPLIAPDIEAAMDYQRQLMAAGPRYVGQGGGGGRGAAGGGGGTTRATAPARRPNAPTTWTNARGQQMTLDARGRAVPAGGGGGGGGAAAPGGASSTSGPTAPRGIEDISNEVARRGLEAGNDSTTQAARRGVENILSGQGGAGSGGSGYQGYNPINDWLAGQLQGDVADRGAADLIRQFLGVDAAGNLPGSGGGGAGQGGRNVSYRPSSRSSFAGGGGASSSPYSSGPPDTVGNSNSYFATELRDLMNSETNDADLQAIIDAQNADVLRGMQSDQWALDAQAQGTGRFGGDMWAGLANQARADASREMGTNASRTRLGEQESRRAMYQNLLGQVNTRDISAMQDATQRYGIDASANAASAGAGAASEAQMRAQNLQALGLLLGHDEFSMGALGGLGEQLSGDQRAAIGYAPDLAGIGLGGLGYANQAAGNLVGHEGNQTSLRNAQMAAGTARAGMNQQAQMFNSGLPQNMVNEYLRNIGLVGGLGGTSTTQGTNVVGGVGANPWSAALMGGAAGYYGGR